MQISGASSGIIAAQPSDRVLLSIDAPAGTDLMRHACELGLEGIVAKRADAPYRGGRVESWIKVRSVKALNFPVIGYVPAQPNSIAAIRLARREGDGLAYVGKAGTGFTMKTAQDVRARLERSSGALRRPQSRCASETRYGSSRNYRRGSNFAA